MECIFDEDRELDWRFKYCQQNDETFLFLTQFWNASLQQFDMEKLAQDSLQQKTPSKQPKH